MISFQTIGMMACIFAVSVLLLNARTSLEEKNSKPGLQHFLTGCCVLLWILSLPVSIIAFFLHMPFSNRLVNLQERMKLRDMVEKDKDDLIKAMKSKIKSLEDQVLDERFNRHEEEHISGLQSGYIRGYRQGYADGLDCSDLPEFEKEQLVLKTGNYAFYLSKCFIKEYKERTKEI